MLSKRAFGDIVLVRKNTHRSSRSVLRADVRLAIRDLELVKRLDGDVRAQTEVQAEPLGRG